MFINVDTTPISINTDMSWIFINVDTTPISFNTDGIWISIIYQC
jgi:hypothetical protein